jgi:hypothetical protein
MTSTDLSTFLMSWLAFLIAINSPCNHLFSHPSSHPLFSEIKMHVSNDKQCD